MASCDYRKANFMDMLRIRKMRNACRQWIDAKNTKTVLLYIFFLFISFVFWLVLTLNNSFQHEYSVPLVIKSLPDSTTMINDIPQSIKVTVKDKGLTMLKYELGNLPTLTLDFSEYSNDNGLFRVSAADLRSGVRNIFSASATVSSVNPDSLRLVYTNLPAKKVPVIMDLDIKPNLQYVINGAVSINEDSVLVYSDRQTLMELNEVYTYHVEERELTDTLRREVAIAPIKNTKIVPKNVVLTIPVEQLIYKRQRVPISVVNQPSNVNVLTFPAIVEASFLVPQSMYRKNVAIKVAVNYNDILETHSNHVAVKVAEIPAICQSVALSVDSVEYLIEKY